jgi:hypothetical protein
MKKLSFVLLSFAFSFHSIAQIPFSDLVLGLQFGGNFNDISATQAVISENTASLSTDRNGIENNAATFNENQKINFEFINNASLLAGAENAQITLSCRVQLDSAWLNNLALNTDINLVNNGKNYLRISKGNLNNVLVLKSGVFNNNATSGTNGFLETSVILRNTANGNLPDWNAGAADWNTFTLSYDGNFGEPVIGLFVNGIAKASNVGTYLTTNLNYNVTLERFEIGSSNFLNQGFKGKIDDIYLYNRSLTLGEILTLDTVNVSTGIYKIESADVVKLFPNPARDILQISADKNLGEIEIYGCAGNLIFKQIVNTPQLSFNLSAYPNGIYFVKVGVKYYKAVKF